MSMNSGPAKQSISRATPAYTTFTSPWCACVWMFRFVCARACACVRECVCARVRVRSHTGLCVPKALLPKANGWDIVSTGRVDGWAPNM